MTLDKLGVGNSGVITSVGGEGALRLRLLDMGLTPRASVTVVKEAPLGDPIQIKIRGYLLSLLISEAKRIEVEAIE
ncbi:MAG: ferrous iron transport protein A [Eubacteriales bacterium]|nr:ferrous iron transport protein A [Eubacteriales bacterium]